MSVITSSPQETKADPEQLLPLVGVVAIEVLGILLSPHLHCHWSPQCRSQPASIEIEFATGGRMRITGPVDARTVSALMKALAQGKRRR